MTVTIADIEFDRVEYDADAGVLYLHVGEPSRAVDYDETPEGHAVRLDRIGKVVGLALIRPRRLLERDGELRVTMPVARIVSAAELAPVLSAGGTASMRPSPHSVSVLDRSERLLDGSQP